MNLWNALSFPFLLKQNRRIILYATLLLFIPILGFIIWLGYAIRLVHHLLQGKSESLPAIKLGSDFGRGMVILFSYILYALPFMGIGFISATFAGMIFGYNPMIVLILNIILWLLYLVLFCAMMVGRIRAAAQDSISPIFEVMDNVSKASNSKTWFLLWAICQLVISAFLLVGVLNIQYLLHVFATWLTGAFVWPLLGLGLFAFALLFVLLSLSNLHLDFQLAQALGYTATTKEKEKRS